MLARCVAESQNTFELTFPSLIYPHSSEYTSRIPAQWVGQHIPHNNSNTTQFISAANKDSSFKIASQIDHKICVSKFSHAAL